MEAFPLASRARQATTCARSRTAAATAANPAMSALAPYLMASAHARTHSRKATKKRGREAMGKRGKGVEEVNHRSAARAESLSIPKPQGSRTRRRCACISVRQEA